MKLHRRIVLFLGCILLGAVIAPRWLVGRDAQAYFVNDLDTQRELADAVADNISRGVKTTAFHTGSARFDGEWAMGTHLMAAIGLAQVIQAHPDLRARYLPAINDAVERLLRDDIYAFAERAWGEAPLQNLDNDHGHAYLGYVALALGALRETDPQTKYAGMHDRIVAAMTRRLEANPQGIVLTYPHEAYPCDIASIVAAIAQHARITGVDRRAIIARSAAIYREHWIDPKSGYLIQSLRMPSGVALDAPRGSGTALAAFFWSFADSTVSDQLDRALMGSGRAEVLGFSGIREYAPDHDGDGDIDSGPVIGGISVSATGFSLAAARRQGDADAFHSLFRTAALFGVPVRHGATTRFLAGGPLGNAIMLAMLSARRL